MVEDYLKTLKDSRKELIQLVKTFGIEDDSKRGKAIKTAIKLLEKEIKDFEQFKHV
jgi:hypothetical protein